MNKSMRLMVLALCATGLVVMQGRASDAGKGLETPLLPVVGETKSDSVAVDIGALAKAAGTPEELSSASSSSKSSPAKSDDGLLKNEKKGFCDRLFSVVSGWSEKKKRAYGYVGVTMLEGINEVYYKFVNTAYGIPAALFIGQLAGIVAADEKSRAKLIGASAIGATVSTVESILHYTADMNIDLLIPASALGFIFYSIVYDLMKRKKNLLNGNRQFGSSFGTLGVKDASTDTAEETLADG